MNTRLIILMAATAFASAGCSNSAGTSAPPATHVTVPSSAQTVPAVEAMVARLPAGTRVYVMDSIAVHAGDEVAVFAAASRVMRTAAKLTVVDAASGETFTFPANATDTPNTNCLCHLFRDIRPHSGRKGAPCDEKRNRHRHSWTQTNTGRSHQYHEP